MSYQTILAQLAGGQSVSNSDSASITITPVVVSNPIPEPGTLSSFLIGGLLAAVSIGVRKYRAKRLN
jgi:hypothetical protein